MRANLQAYWRASRGQIVSAVLIFAPALALPPFSLFDDRAVGMLQSHFFLEMFAVIVALLIAVISWHALKNAPTPDAGIVLAGFGAVALVDLFHALSYDGMPRLVTDSSTPKAIFFWLAGRTLVVLTLLMLALRVRPALHRRLWLAAALLCGGGVFWVGTFALDRLPLTYVEGRGITRFKVFYEYALFAANIGLALLFIWRARSDGRNNSFALASSCLIMAMGEIVFANYKAPSDFLNNFGHVFKVASYIFLYRAVFVSAIELPWRQTRASEARFRALTELSADWFWEQDAAFRFTQVSRGAAPVGGGSMLGLRLWELPLVENDAALWRAHRDALGRREPFKDLVCQIDSDAGACRWISLSGGPVLGDCGELLGYRGIGSDITARKAAERQIEFLAYHDPLTALPNRLMLQDCFERAKARAAREHFQMALLYLDIDNFKSVNDTLGHDVGDALLKAIAARLEQIVHAGDTVARQGGDEFLMLLSDLPNGEPLALFLARLIDWMQEPFMIAGHELLISASVGGAIFPTDGDSFDMLRRNADLAMYRAKDCGRNTYRFFDEDMNVEAAQHLKLRNGLRHALERDEFVLHYQPQIDLSSGAVTGVEALIRWQHPELGMVPPAHFIPVAEESGMIVPIGAWVLRQACGQARAWQRDGLAPMTMAVNLSAIQFKRGDVEQSVQAALDDSGLDPALLELELTESILIQDVDNVLACVKRLKLLGVKLSIDDFGTGYSSLSYLKRFAVDKLKIDQSFVRELTTSPDDEAIVRAIIQMARSLNLGTIAEGVETPEILEKLRACGCDEVQGYYFSRPLPAPQMRAFLEREGRRAATAC